MVNKSVWSVALLAAVLVVLQSVDAATVRVPANQPTIQAGINAAASHDTVLVAPGTYSGSGNRDITFNGKAVKLISETGAENTIIDCGSSHRGALFDHYESSQALFSGFTIKNASEAIRLSRASTTIRGCILGQNTEYGIACVTYCYPLIDSTVISGCSSCGVSLSSSNPVLQSCLISGNAGGGLYSINSDSITLHDCELVGNSGFGAIVSNDRVGLYLTDCIFQSNTGDVAGSVYVGPNGEQSRIQMTGCMFTGNKGISGPGLFNIENCDILATDCLFRQNGDRDYSDAFLMMLEDDSECLFRRCVFEENYGVCIHPSGGSTLDLDSCLFTENQSWEYVIYADGDLTVSNCTFTTNYMHSAFGMAITIASIFGQVTLSNTIISFTDNSIPLDAYPAPTITCCDFFGNEEGDWVYTYADLLGVNGNMCADPLFCHRTSFWFDLKHTSPCAPANNECGVLIGALGVGCCGDVDGAEGVDIDDVVYLINFIFAGGPEPEPVLEGDSDCSDFVDIDDVVYGITYIFMGGPDPCADCQ
jgi:parallel beta-helix repeat protein